MSESKESPDLPAQAGPDSLAQPNSPPLPEPQSATAYFNRGFALCAAGRRAEALAAYDRALDLRPDYVEVLSNRGYLLAELGRNSEALESFERALATRAELPPALIGSGLVLQRMKRPSESLARFDAALAVEPRDVNSLVGRAASLRALGRYEDAIATYDTIIALDPGSVAAHHNRGDSLVKLNRFEDAVASYDRVIELRPEHLTALHNRGNALVELGRFQDALSSYDKAIALNASYVDAHYNRGNLMRRLFRFDEAIGSYERALALAPQHGYALGELAAAKLAICDWNETARLARALDTQVLEGRSTFSPFVYLGYSSNPALHLKCAQNFIRCAMPSPPPPIWRGERWRNDKIRLAYLSADFNRHATAYLIAGLFEAHDRSRFEIIGISYGPDDKSDMRARLIAGFDAFHDVRAHSDRDVAQMLHGLKIDIALDLKGYTTDTRIGILAHRPCPIQVNYLGYPGSMGVDFIDYVVADHVLVPYEGREFNTEAIVYLPDTFQVNDSKQAISPRSFTRAEFGLPEGAFVFCCFNNSYKLTAPIFDVWMRLLESVEGSVLWLLQGHPLATLNLQREARARGIDPARLVFAKRIGHEEHLARHRLADLCLDTLPVNALTTASDALWAGLPMVTCAGTTAPGRGGASVLLALGLSELVTQNLADYETLARNLAADHSLLAATRHKLETNRATHPLFNTNRYARHLESAYVTMWETWQSGKRPSSFSVPPLGASSP